MRNIQVVWVGFLAHKDRNDSEEIFRWFGLGFWLTRTGMTLRKYSGGLGWVCGCGTIVKPQKTIIGYTHGDPNF